MTFDFKLYIVGGYLLGLLLGLYQYITVPSFVLLLKNYIGYCIIQVDYLVK